MAAEGLACRASAKLARSACRSMLAQARNSAAVHVAVIVVLSRQILEAGVLPQEAQTHGANWPVTLLANDDFGDTLVRSVFVIHFVTVDEGDDIGVLLDGAGFAQVGHDRTL